MGLLVSTKYSLEAEYGLACLLEQNTVWNYNSNWPEVPAREKCSGLHSLVYFLNRRCFINA